jgi:hypothetical protein
MTDQRKKRRPNAVLGYFKLVWMLLVMLVLLPVWFIRGIATRARFRAELRTAGVPPEAAKRLSDRYKLRLWELSRISSTANR